jgi:hypothetical protein
MFSDCLLKRGLARPLVFGLAVGLWGSGVGLARAETALEQLRAAPKPHFREGHTLPPLTRWGWTMPFEVRLELTEHWGYALEFGGYVTPEAVKELDDPNSVPSRLCALAASDPKRYPLCVLTIHGDFGELPEEVWCHNAAGELPEGQRIWSPEAPDEVFRQAAEAWAAPIRKVREKAPIAIILNGGEYALSVYGHHGRYWSQDPKVMAAKGDREWYDYISERKAHQELILSEAFRAAVPDRQLYLYYYTDGCPHRNRYDGWWTWAWDYRYMRPVSDLPNTSLYYLHFNSGWTGDNDMLTQALNGVAQQIAAGDPLSYNWLCAGWVRENLGEKAFSDPEHYMGFLKCFYTAGMIGGVAGYFSYPGEDDPNWLWQMMVLSHAHALFSHLEEFLRQGDLLPGPEPHRWSRDLPAYEFPTGDPDLRVLARKHRQRPEWLLTAWAAGGADRNATVTIPGLGTVTLLARSCGSVYRATLEEGKPSLRWVDEDGMRPTAGW